MIALRFVVREFTTTRIMTTAPAAMTPNDRGSPKPSSAAVEKPTMSSAAPTMMRALTWHQSMIRSEWGDVQSKKVEGPPKIRKSGLFRWVEVEEENQERNGHTANR